MRRPFAVLGLVVALLPGDGRANHDSLPEPPPQSTSQKLLTRLHLDRTAVTVSGLSSGGFFAHQFHVAFSSLVKGAGILAGGPYGCVETIPNPWLPFWAVALDRVSAAVVACTHYYGDRYYGLRPSAPQAEDSLRIIRAAADQGLIDNPSNLADSRVWLFHGKSDALVPLQVMETLERLYVRASAVLIESEAMRRDGFVIPLSRPSLEEMSDDQVLLTGSAATGGALR